MRTLCHHLLRAVAAPLPMLYAAAAVMLQEELPQQTSAVYLQMSCDLSTFAHNDSDAY